MTMKLTKECLMDLELAKGICMNLELESVNHMDLVSGNEHHMDLELEKGNHIVLELEKDHKCGVKDSLITLVLAKEACWLNRLQIPDCDINSVDRALLG